MNNENVKIIINEVDNTSPASRGLDSTDIAFIPGFSSKPTAPVNVPTLCTSVTEFKTIFGDEPYVLTSADVEAYSNYGFTSDTYDKSYVYAVELLSQGMPVIYCNLATFVCREFTLHSSFSPSTEFEKSSDESCYIVTQEINPDDLKDIGGSGTLRETATITFNVPFSSANPEYVDVTVEGIENINADDIKEITLSYGNKTYSNKSSISKIDGNDSITINVVFYAAKLVDKEIIKFSIRDTVISTIVLDAFYGTTPKIDDILDEISDKSVYSVKYITSGGYPSAVADVNTKSGKNAFAYKMLEAAATRGDAVALIDYQNQLIDPIQSAAGGQKSFYDIMSSLFTSTTNNTEYGAAMYPWATYSCTNSISDSTKTDVNLPGSFAYLMCVAKAVKTSPNWLAMAGVSRGRVPGIKSLSTINGILSNKVAEEMQPKFGSEGKTLSINCITDIKPYGLTLWGNRTLKHLELDKATVALNFLNTRNMLSDIKKVLYTTAKSLMFEQNSDALWLKFKTGVSPLLNQLKSGNGISDFKIIKGTTKYNGDALTKGEISAVIKIYPMYAVEYFELTVDISDEDVTVS